MTGIEIIIGGAVTTIVAYLLGKKKTKAEIQKTEMDSVEKAVTIWRNLAQDFKKEVEELRVQISDLRGEISDLQHENQEFRGQVSDLQHENQTLRNEISKLSDIINEHGLEKH